MKKLLIAILILATGCSQIAPVEIQIEAAVRIVPLSVAESPLSTLIPGPSPLGTPVPPDRSEAAPELEPLSPCENGGASYSKQFTWVPQTRYFSPNEGTCWCFDLPEDESGMCLPVHPEFPAEVTWVPAETDRDPGAVCWCWNVGVDYSRFRPMLPETGRNQ